MIKSTLKSFLRSLGWKLHRVNPATDPFAQTIAVLNHVGSNIIFDVGANVGQFALGIRASGFNGKIISFEPLARAHSKLLTASRRDPAWTIHSRTAIGNKDGEINVNISGNSVSSSVLPMLELHAEASKNSAYVGIETVPVARLDTIAFSYLSQNCRLFLKIDTQGFEWEVLDGALETLKLSHGVLLEMTLVPLYEGQRLWQDVIERMKLHGFALWSIQPGFTDLQTGRTLQVDAIFLRI